MASCNRRVRGDITIRYRQADEISEALRLEDYALAGKVQVTDGKGLPATRWKARTSTT
jgi:hypothetical protein